MAKTAEDLIQKQLLISVMLERVRPVSLDEFDKVMSEVLDDTLLSIAKAKNPMIVKTQRQILAEVTRQLKDIYGDFPEWIKVDEEFASQLAYESSVASMESQPSVIKAGITAISYDRLNKDTIETLLSPNRQLGSTGFTLNDMVKDLQDYQTKRTRQILAKGVTAKQTPHEITRSVQNLWGDVTKHRADAVVRTAMIDAANVGRHQSDKIFDEVIIGYLSMAVLDNRTSKICIPLHLKKYMRKPNQTAYGLLESIPDKPPRHPRCRSSLLKLTKDTMELLHDTDRTATIWDKDDRIQHRDGSTSMRLSAKDATHKRLRADSTYQEFYDTLTINQQASIVGSKRKVELMRKGKLSLSEVLKTQRTGQIRYLTNEEILKIVK